MRLVIVGPSMVAIVGAMREIGIPHVPFLRGHHVVHDRHTLDRIRGIDRFHWCAIPDHEPDVRVREILSSSSRHPRTTGELPFHEAIARALAWRIWHEC